jgi:hypothetical protein
MAVDASIAALATFGAALAFFAGLGAAWGGGVGASGAGCSFWIAAQMREVALAVFELLDRLQVAEERGAGLSPKSPELLRADRR